MIVRPSERARCRCETTTIPLPDGDITAVVTLNLECGVHSFPGDKWHSSAHLLKYAGYIERETGRWYSSHEAHDIYHARAEEGGFWPYFQSLFRQETPSEVEARLLAELS